MTLLETQSASFEALADRVEVLRKSMSFSLAAEHALREFVLCQSFQSELIAEAVCSAQSLPTQQDVDSKFGNPCLTIAHRGDFHVQLLYWRDGTTSIHEHAFEGAFCVLSGSSVHTEYGFKSDSDVLGPLVGGQLAFNNTELLRAGDVREIRRGAGLIHSVFHLDRPTVSLVVRTAFADHDRPQYEYGRRVAFDPFRRVPLELRQLQQLELAMDCFPGKVDALLHALLRSSGPWLAYQALECVARKRGSFASLRPFQEEFEKRHGSDVAGFEESISARLRVENIVNRRELIVHTDHRFLLALLMLLPTRELLLSFVKARHPDSSAVDLVLQWIADLANQTCEPKWGTSVLGFEIDQSAQRFLHLILEGESVDRAANDASPDPREQAELGLVLPRLSLLQPLFA